MLNEFYKTIKNNEIRRSVFHIPHPTSHIPLSTTLLLTTLTTLLLACGCAKQPPRINRLQWPSMGTIAAVQSIDISTAQGLRTIAIEEFKVVEDELSTWNEQSTLSLINNRAGTATPTPVSDTFREILNISTVVSYQSSGAFSALIGPVMHAWGFGNIQTPFAPPSSDSLRAALLLSDQSEIKIESVSGTQTVQLNLQGMKLDFGAIAKGYAVDLAWKKAKAANLNNVMIDLGGNLRVIGEAFPGRGGWLTGVKDPFNRDNLIAKLLILDGEAIATSGNYERFVEINGEHCAHIIDGRTAMPVKGMAGVTVVAPDAATADALSTTLFVLGVEEGKKLIKEHYPNSLALWIPDKQPAEIIATDKMEARLKRD